MKKIVVGITGGIAAYKTLDLIQRLKEENFQVFVVMTKSATKFLTPLIPETLTGNSVYTDIFSNPLIHIELIKDASALIIAPATYNIMGKVASGIADDLLTTLIAAAKCPVVFAPAMNVRMWENKVLENNIKKLKSQGYQIIEPEEGKLACGDYGKGRLPPVENILLEILRIIEKSEKMKDKHVLITTGRTEENLDIARVITNRSSGMLGSLIAENFYRKGADITVIAGVMEYPLSPLIKKIEIHTTKELEQAVLARIETTDILVMNAAVADYRPINKAQEKLKAKYVSLTLEHTQDILSKIKPISSGIFKVGFSLEKEQPVERAKAKLKEKGLDMIVINPPETQRSEWITPTILYRDLRKEDFPKMHKKEFSKILVDRVESEYGSRR